MHRFFSISLYNDQERLVQHIILPVPCEVYESFIREGMSVRDFHKNAFLPYRIVACRETIFNTKLIVTNKNGESSIESELEVDGNKVKYNG